MSLLCDSWSLTTFRTPTVVETARPHLCGAGKGGSSVEGGSLRCILSIAYAVLASNSAPLSLSWIRRSYSDSCFLDSSLYPELADVQWYGQEKAKPGTLV